MKKTLKVVAYILIILAIIGYVWGGGSSSELKEGEISCQECGKPFKEGTGWNALGYNQIGKPDHELSHYCSQICAMDNVTK